MDPDNTNPNAPSADGSVDFTNLTGTSDNGLSMADSMASAAESLTSAGMAANLQSNAIGLDQIGGDTSSGIAPSVEPIVPSAPLPGSIGSAVSGPATTGTTIADPTMNTAPVDNLTTEPAISPITPTGESTPVTTPMLDSFNTAPMAEPVQVVNPNTFEAPTPNENLQAQFDPFNPQQQPAAPAMQPATAPAAPAAPSIRSKGGFDFQSFFDLKTIITCSVAALFLVTTIVFGVMFNKAANTPQIEYIDTTPPPVVSTMSCTVAGEYGYLAGYEEGRPAYGSRSMVLRFSDDNLTGFGESYVINYDSNIDAVVAASTLAANLTTQYKDLDLNLEVSSGAEDVTATVTSTETDGAAYTRDIALTLVYGEDKLAKSLYAEDAKAYLTELGYVCVEE